ncbi:MAG: universal stress protein [Deltaproteobacteria bacterium]|nr:universal stress protein [Deltaproteobacteria bacterium]MBW2042175.1 universal stress protein [Deltaproteobacteria bacterium]MBW2132887.1 universal stress protein [Deltaproteobacteria bacterium]
MKIMVGMDESEVAAKVLDLAIRHAKAFEGSLELVISMEKGDESEQEEIRAAEKFLEAQKKRGEAEGLPCNTHLLIRGLTPGEDLVQFAKENNAEEIIIGVRRKSKVGKLMFGSTAQHVILKAHCPVVTIK